jgi:hypothetical protein
MDYVSTNEQIAGALSKILPKPCDGARLQYYTKPQKEFSDLG